MKAFVVTIWLCTVCSSLFAQSYLDWEQCKTEDDFVKYFTKNIQSLDPLEGVYIMRLELIQKSPWLGEQKTVEEANVAFVKDSSDFFFQCNLDSNMISSLPIIKKAGGNSYYFNLYPNLRNKDYTPIKIKFIYNDGHFSLIREFSNKEFQSMFGDGKGSAVRTWLKIEAQKTFPTLEMYAQSVELKRREKEEIKSEWSGTGFALNGGYVVTNYHVIDGAKKILLQGVTNNFAEQYTAEIVAVDKHNDLAVLRVTDSRFKGFSQIPYKVSTSTSDVGENIFVLGYPLISTMGDEIKLTTGVISSKTGYQGDVSQYQISAPIQPGNSGGPLFDRKGNIIGVVSAKHIEAENVGYAVKASFLKTLLETFSNETVLPNKNMVSELPLSNRVKRVKDFVFFIYCSAK